MAKNAATVWEIRTTGSNTNGGGFANLSPGVSVDYSQQDTPILTRADFQKGTGTNDITTAAGVACFTQAMIGNIIWITPTTIIYFYQITAVSGDLKTITVDVVVPSFTGKTGNVGGAYKFGGTSDQQFFSSVSVASGNTVYVQVGTYTLIAGYSPHASASVTYIGYNAIRNDNPTGANRPVINCATYGVIFSGSLYAYNLIFTGTASIVITFSVDSGVYNCKFVNTYLAGTDRVALSMSPGVTVRLVFCEVSSLRGIGISNISSGSLIVQSCYFHDGNCGIRAGGMLIVNDCIFSNHSIVGAVAPIGINVSGSYEARISGCIFYAATTGIQNTSVLNKACVIVNNIFDACGTGISWYSGGDPLKNYMNYNCYHCSVADTVNITKGPNDITADPLFVDPANADFRYNLGSPCFNTGMQVDSIVGL